MTAALFSWACLFAAPTLAKDAHELLGERFYRVELVLFSQEPAGPATEEALLQPSRLEHDPERLTQFVDWPYQRPHWFVSNAPAEDAVDPLLDFDDEPAATEDTEVAEVENTTELDRDPLSSEGSALSLPSRTLHDLAFDEALFDATSFNDAPLAPERRQTVTLQEAQNALDEALSELRTRLEAELHHLTVARDDERFRLSDAVEHLQQEQGISVLFAGSWLEKPPPRETPEPLWLQLSVEPEDENSSFAEEVRAPMLEGVVTLTLGRYLHFSADLAYTLYADPLEEPSAAPEAAWMPSQPPVAGAAAFSPATNTDLRRPLPQAGLQQPLSAPAPTADEPTTLPLSNDADQAPEPLLIRFQQRRRMKSGEVHYLDHPRLGVLLRVDPVPLDAASETALAQLKGLEQG